TEGDEGGEGTGTEGDEAESNVPGDEGEAPDPATVEDLADRLEEYRSDLEAARGPYSEEVVEEIEDIEATLRETRYTEAGERSIRDAVETLAGEISAHVGTTVSISGPGVADTADALGDAAEAVTDSDLDPDADADAIAALLDATDDLRAGVDAAESWTDLEIRERLQRDGFYDVLEPELRKDFPPEWNAVLVYADEYKQSRDSEAVEQILLALDVFDSDFMEENILETFERIAPPEAFDAVHERAQRRNHLAIEVLGAIGDERAVETLVDFLDGARPLELKTLEALGAIGSREATAPIADRLAADAAAVRSTAARALGRIGDPRAIDPLAATLEGDDADEVRASAAWALVQIGTDRALDAARPYADDRSPLVASAAPEHT
ncbi:MAG: HEAT repeat domain-containing protein, partial [Halococcoides sp.]